MKTKVIDILNEICDDVDAYVIDNYSGRGMWGQTCLAVSVPETMPFLERAIEAGLKGAKIDSLGLGYVIYWPRYGVNSEIDKMVLVKEEDINNLVD